MNIGILGAGAWGTALGIALAAQHEVALWARDAVAVAEMARQRENAHYLPGFTFPAGLVPSNDLAAVVQQSDLLIVMTPVAAMRGLLVRLRQMQCAVPLVWACKGFEVDTSSLPHQIVAEELGPDYLCGTLSGPSFAQEVASGLPTALTLAASDAAFAHAWAVHLHTHHLRIYSSTDVIGVELGGALKNIMAIAAGVSDGLRLGYNARAALITRGLAEISRLGVALGGRAETFMGLAGAGDLILTCTADLSRNRTVGLRLAGGQKLEAVLDGLGHVAEGVYAARGAQRLARQLGVPMPIVEVVNEILAGSLLPRDAVERLLNREPKAELN